MTTFSEIAERWEWDGIVATRRSVAIAVRATGHPLGLTRTGMPYVEPYVGMRVETCDGQPGTIVDLRRTEHEPDPLAEIETENGRVFLFQAALLGYCSERA